MPRFFALLVSAILFILGVGIVLGQILRFLGVSRMSRRRRLKEQKLILSELRALNIDRAPWKKHEIDLLSAKLEYKVKKRLFSKWVEGYAQTIYSEPVLPFTARVYAHDQYILCFTTNNQHYTLMGLGKLVEAYIGHDKVGAFQRNDLISNGKVLASIQPEGNRYDTILVEDRDLGHINPESKGELVTERKMEMVLDEVIDGSNLGVFTLVLGYALFRPVMESL